MKIDFTEKERVKRSLYYNCIRLWDQLNSDVQSAQNIFEFVKRLQYVDLSKMR